MLSNSAVMDRPWRDALPKLESVTKCVTTRVTIYFLLDLFGFGIFAMRYHALSLLFLKDIYAYIYKFDGNAW